MKILTFTILLTSSAGSVFDLAARTTQLPVGTPDVERLVQAYWAAAPGPGQEAAIADIVASGASFGVVYQHLRAGPSYSPDAATGRIESRRVGSAGLSHPYFFVVPENYDHTKKYPVRFFLHGGVARAQWDSDGAWWRNWQRLASSEYIAVFPASWRQSRWWYGSQVENIEAILAAIKRDYNVDEDRVYMFGVSDGGTGAYFFAARAPTPWAAFVPLIGFPGVLANPRVRADGDMFAANFASRPFYVVNGDTDRLYPTRLVRPYMELFEAYGADLSFRGKPAGHTTSWWPEEQPAIDRFLDSRSRDAIPDGLVWQTERTDRYNRFSWVRIDELRPVEGENGPDASLPDDPFPQSETNGWISVRRSGQRVIVQTRDVRRYTLLLSPEEIDLERSIEVVTNGNLSYRGMARGDIETLMRWVNVDHDRAMLFGAELEIVLR